MARSKNQGKKAAARKRAKALKRKNTKAVGRRHDDLSVRPFLQQALDVAIETARRRAAGELAPEWAYECSYVPEAARSAVANGQLMDGIPLHPHHIAKLRAWLCEDVPWGLVDVRTRTEASLLAELARVGVDMDEARFRELAAGEPSAWRLGQRLTDGPIEPEHLLGSIATALWCRWLPDQPCYEVVCDRIQYGYHTLDGTKKVPVGAWLGAWFDLLSLLPDQIRTLAEAQHESGVLQSLSNWVGDMHDAVVGGARVQPAQVEPALQYVRSLKRFDDPPLEGLLGDEAELLALGGRQDEGERLLEARIEQDPGDAMAYARLADILSDSHPRIRPDHRRASEILLRGLSRRLRNDADWGLQSRLRWLESSGPEQG